jgi:hypothetical protein
MKMGRSRLVVLMLTLLMALAGCAGDRPDDSDSGEFTPRPDTTPGTNSSSPGTTDPTNPTNPGTTDPTNPGTSNPTNPTNPGTTDPTNPGTTDPTNPPADGCGAITEEGTCNQDVLTFCLEGEVVSANCAEFGLNCGFVSPEYGSDCLTPVGEDCLFEGPNGLAIGLCAGENAGCVVDETEAACRSGVGTCDPAGDDVCSGDYLILLCQVNQPFALDCAAFGGACDANEGACTGLPVGADCDEEVLLCAPGLFCAANTCQAPEPVCGGVDELGACNGTMLSFCNEDDSGDENLVEYDCAGLFPGGATTSCIEVGDGYHDCAVNPGDQCLYFTATGDPVLASCSGPAPGCVWGATGVTCQSNVGACSDTMGWCFANRLVLDCNGTQPFVLDCSAAGGQCNEAGAVCSNVPAGGSCGEDLLECAAGLTCVGETATSFGVCRAQ